MKTKGMNCKKVKRLLNCYLDGELTSKAAIMVEEHMRVCSQCKEYLNNVKRIGRALKIYGFEEPSESYITERAWNHIRTSIERRNEFNLSIFFQSLWRWLTFYPRPIWTAALAAASLIMLLVTVNTGRYNGMELARPTIEYMESQSSQVMVLMPEQESITVIWVFEKA